MTTMCAPSALPQLSDNNLIELLQECISCIQEDAFHPVLYQALSALHQYIACQQQRLLREPTTTHDLSENSWKKTRPSFCRDLEGGTNGVLAYGWFQAMVSTDDDTFVWEQVLLLLVDPSLSEEGDSNIEGEPHLRVANENNSGNSSSPELVTRNHFPLRSMVCEYQDFYGDPRLILRHKDDDNEFVTLRCDSASAAKAWVSELEILLQASPENSKDLDSMVDESVEVEMDEYDTNVVHVASKSWDEDQNMDTDRTLGKDPQETIHQSATARKQLAEEKIQELEEPTASPKFQHHHKPHSVAENLQHNHAHSDIAARVAAPPPPPQKPSIAQQRHSQNVQSRQQELQQTKVQSPHTKFHQQQPAATSQMQHTKATVAAHNPQTTTTPTQHATPAVKAAPNPQMSKEMRVEQQKKQAAERRKQDVELQRRLAREHQREKDLQSKLSFFETEKRKEELKARNSSGGDSNALLRQIAQQMTEVQNEIREVQARANEIKREIEQRKHQPLQFAGNTTLNTATLASQKRLEEQANLLEAQKKAAAEKRRQELDEQRRKAREVQRIKEEEKKRRLMELEQRRQDLMEKAKTGKGNAEDSVLFKKVSNNMFALDEEAERKRAEEKSQEPSEETDPDVARMRIAEQARQKELDDEMERSTRSSPLGTSEKGNAFRTNSAPSASSHADPFEHLQTAGQGSMRRPSSMSGATPGSHDHTSATSQSSFFNPSNPPPSSPPSYSPRAHQPQYETTSPSPPYYSPRAHLSQHQPQYEATSPSTPSHSARAHQAQHQPQYQGTSPHHPPSFTNRNAASSSTASGPRHEPTSGLNQKYRSLVNTDEDASNQTDLKKKIIVGWGLQPPEMLGLRPIDQLLMTIQTVFPPAYDLPAHSYFDGWKAMSDRDLRNGMSLDEKKLDKAVRKLRFFLHPDKLPRDLTDDQQFVCKLLWDITNDSYAEYKKALEELDWMN